MKANYKDSQFGVFWIEKHNIQPRSIKSVTKCLLKTYHATWEGRVRHRMIERVGDYVTYSFKSCDCVKVQLTAIQDCFKQVWVIVETYRIDT